MPSSKNKNSSAADDFNSQLNKKYQEIQNYVGNQKAGEKRSPDTKFAEKMQESAGKRTSDLQESSDKLIKDLWGKQAMMEENERKRNAVNRPKIAPIKNKKPSNQNLDQANYNQNLDEPPQQDDTPPEEPQEDQPEGDGDEEQGDRSKKKKQDADKNKPSAGKTAKEEAGKEVAKQAEKKAAEGAFQKALATFGGIYGKAAAWLITWRKWLPPLIGLGIVFNGFIFLLIFLTMGVVFSGACGKTLPNQENLADPQNVNHLKLLKALSGDKTDKQKYILSNSKTILDKLKQMKTDNTIPQDDISTVDEIIVQLNIVINANGQGDAAKAAASKASALVTQLANKYNPAPDPTAK